MRHPTLRSLPSETRRDRVRRRPVVPLLAALGLLAAGAPLDAPRARESVRDDGPAAAGLESGRDLFAQTCAACHQESGCGLPGAFPPLAQSDYLLGDKTRAITTVLNGLQGPVEVNGERYDGVMPSHRFLTDERLAAVLTYVRTSWGNRATPVLAHEVRRIRSTTAAMTAPGAGAPCTGGPPGGAGPPATASACCAGCPHAGACAGAGPRGMRAGRRAGPVAGRPCQRP